MLTIRTGLLFNFTVRFFGSFLFLIFYSCASENKSNEAKYASLVDSVGYVGIASCRQCHADKYETYMQTGMGKSFDRASSAKSSAAFSPLLTIHDKYNNLFYHPSMIKDSFTVLEFRKDKNDTIYRREEAVSWIVGSGQHTNSHIMDVNGYLYQLPVTFYTQKGHWDLAPGYEGGFNSRFSRAIGPECMTCHNAYPDLVEGSENKYRFVPNGIDCERCHGPGEKHVEAMLAGKVKDVTTEIDYTIVNPAKLPINLQLDVCQRCHIQGNAVLKDDKSFFDFRPGMRLSDVMNVYMPSFKNDDTHIMASHVERMKMSECFKVSLVEAEKYHKSNPSLKPYKNALTCITCHDPHVSVLKTGSEIFNGKCISCHSGNSHSTIPVNPAVTGRQCSENKSVRVKSSDNCVGCHMPKGGTIDIPHVTATDHYIRKPVQEKDLNRIKEFTGLVCINNSEDDKKSRAEAYLSYFEKFSRNPAFLDSAARYLNGTGDQGIRSNFANLIRLSYLREDYGRVIKLAQDHPDIPKPTKPSATTMEDAWTAYRIGEAFSNKGGLSEARQYYRLAVGLAPFHLDFRNKLAGVEMDLGDMENARSNYNFIISENPKYTSAYVSLGFLILTADNNMKQAERMYDKALALDPDHIQALINKAGILLFRGENENAGRLLAAVIKLDPDNQQASKMISNMKAQLSN